VIVVTGHMRAAGQAMRAGATAAILKPFDVDELLRVIAALLRQQATDNGR
jgi:DNA-binding NtrC family response regulator